MNYYRQNIDALSSFFAMGCKTEKFLGLEIEHFVVDKSSGLSIPYKGGIEALLKRMQPLYGKPILTDGKLIGISREGADITLEPAAQLEISFGPCVGLTCLVDYYRNFREIITPLLDDMGWELAFSGYHPKSKIGDLPLIPKKRYAYMTEYFRTSGDCGKFMMKGTAATQVSIDYEDEADFKRKFRVANALSPIFSLICDNVTAFEGKPFTGHLLRAHIWNNVDPVRSSLANGALDGDYGFEEYAGYIYDMPPILLVDGEETHYTGRTLNSELFADKPLTEQDMEHITTMAFPDVRLKKRIEIRMADSIPFEESLAYTALIKGLFYSEKNLNYLYNETLDVRNFHTDEAKQALMKEGFEATVYGKPVRHWTKTMYEMAEDALGDELTFLQPINRRMIP